MPVPDLPPRPETSGVPPGEPSVPDVLQQPILPPAQLTARPLAPAEREAAPPAPTALPASALRSAVQNIGRSAAAVERPETDDVMEVPITAATDGPPPEEHLPATAQPAEPDPAPEAAAGDPPVGPPGPPPRPVPGAEPPEDDGERETVPLNELSVESLTPPSETVLQEFRQAIEVITQAPGIDHTRQDMNVDHVAGAEGESRISAGITVETNQVTGARVPTFSRASARMVIMTPARMVIEFRDGQTNNYDDLNPGVVEANYAAARSTAGPGTQEWLDTVRDLASSPAIDRQSAENLDFRVAAAQAVIDSAPVDEGVLPTVATTKVHTVQAGGTTITVSRVEGNEAFMQGVTADTVLESVTAELASKERLMYTRFADGSEEMAVVVPTAAQRDELLQRGLPATLAEEYANVPRSQREPGSYQPTSGLTARLQRTLTDTARRAQAERGWLGNMRRWFRGNDS